VGEGRVRPVLGADQNDRALGERCGQLAEKTEIVALNKIDAVAPDELKKQKDRLKRAAKKTPLLISGATGQGVKEALRALADVIGDKQVTSRAKRAAQMTPWEA